MNSSRIMIGPCRVIKAACVPRVRAASHRVDRENSMGTVARAEHAWSLIDNARKYTMELLQSVPQERWLEMPGGCPSHLAWQAGHLAVAEYGLGLYRQRGLQDGDDLLLPSSVRKQYGKGSVPDPRPENNLSPAELLDLLQRVHQAVGQQVLGMTEADLDRPTDPPHFAWPTSYGTLLFCSAHEMMHAGQIGLIRRLLGLAPLR